MIGVSGVFADGAKNNFFGSVNVLLEELNGNDPIARAHAMQMLPYHGDAAVVTLRDQLKSEDPSLAFTSFVVLMQISNEMNAPGRDGSKVACELMQLLAPERSEKEKVFGLRLLERTVPEGVSLDPIARLLTGIEGDMLREKARVCLERLNTNSARIVLENAIAASDEAFQCAIINSLGMMQFKESLPLLRQLATSASPAIRAATAHALVWAANPQDIALIQCASKADNATVFDVYDSVLSYANELEASCCNASRALARDIYRSLLATPSLNPVVVGGAMVGLSRIGEPEDIHVLLASIQSCADLCTRQIGIGALRTISGGPEGTRLIVDAYAGLNDTEKPNMLLTIGLRGHDTGADLAIKEAVNANVSIRLAAIEAIGNIGQPSGLDTLLNTAKAMIGSDVSTEVVDTALLNMARKRASAGDHDNAAKAFLALLELSKDDAMQSKALVGLAASPTANAFDAVMQAMDDKKLETAGKGALLSISAKLFVQGDADKASEGLARVRALDSSAQVIIAYAQAIKDFGGNIDLSNALGAIGKWYLIGPFKIEGSVLDDANWNVNYIDPAAEFNPAAKVEYNANSFEWKKVETNDAFGMVSLGTSLGDETASNCYAYAYAEIEVPERTQATLLMGSDDGIAVWLNGYKTFENKIDRGYAPDSDQKPIRLEAGKNRILVRISQGGAGWAFGLRITQRDGIATNFNIVSPAN